MNMMFHLKMLFFEGFYNEMVKFIHSLFESALKTNTSLKFAVVTGCLRISKESIFTGLNNLNVFSILDANYREQFGFTESDVLKICKDYDITIIVQKCLKNFTNKKKKHLC